MTAIPAHRRRRAGRRGGWESAGLAPAMMPVKMGFLWGKTQGEYSPSPAQKKAAMLSQEALAAEGGRQSDPAGCWLAL